MVINIDEIDNYVKFAKFPAAKDDMIEAANSHGAGKEVLTVLNQLPKKKYRNRAEVKKMLNDFIQTQRETGPR